MVPGWTDVTEGGRSVGRSVCWRRQESSSACWEGEEDGSRVSM